MQYLSKLLAMASDAGASVQSLPMAAHVLAGVGLAAGIILWLMGRKVLKPIFSVLGALGGAAVGFSLMAQTRDTFFGVPSPYIGLTVGATLGLGAAIMLFRFAVAISTGLAIGLAGVLISAAYLHFTPTPDPLRIPATSALSAPGYDPAGLTPRQQAQAAAKSMADQVQEFLSEKAGDVRSAWNGRTEHDRVVLGVSGLGAAIAGFVLGVFFPGRSAAIATALFGSAIWLGAAAWLITAVGAPGHRYLDQSAVVWLVVWFVVAAAGVGLQVTGIRRHKPAKAE